MTVVKLNDKFKVSKFGTYELDYELEHDIPDELEGSIHLIEYSKECDTYYYKYSLNNIRYNNNIKILLNDEYTYSFKLIVDKCDDLSQYTILNSRFTISNSKYD